MRWFGESNTETGAEPSRLPPEASEAAGRVNHRIEALETALAALQGLASEAADTRKRLEADAQDIRNLLDAHGAKFADLFFAVSEGIQNVKRHENRIRATVRRARAELEEGGIYSPGLDAEAAELQLVDGGGGPETPVQPVHEDVAGFDPTGLPGSWGPGDSDLLTG